MPLTNLGLTGNIILAYALKTGSFTLVNSSNNVVGWDTSGGVGTAVIPSATGATGQEFIITLVTAGNLLTINTTAGQTVGGFASGVLKMATVNDTIRIVSDGTNWKIIHMNINVSMRRSNSAGTSINNSATTIVPWATSVDADTLAGFSTNTYTVPFSGRYKVDVMLAFTANGTGTRQMWVGKNGTSTGSGINTLPGSAAVNTTSVYSMEIDCVTGDTLAVYVFQTSGGALALSTNSGECMFSIVRVA